MLRVLGKTNAHITRLMRTSSNPSLPPGTRPPHDNGTPLDPERILAGLLETANLVATGRPEAAPENGGSAANFQALLRVLAYSYATGIYASSEIKAALNGDPILRYLAAGQRPESGAMRRFRRRNRHTLERCLAQTLERSWSASGSSTESLRPSPEAYVQASLERWSVQAQKPDFETEAANRVRKAICDDAAHLDE